MHTLMQPDDGNRAFPGGDGMLLGVSRWVFRAGKEGYGERGQITLMSEQCLRALLRFRKKLADVLCLPQQSRVLTNPGHNFGVLRK